MKKLIIATSTAVSMILALALVQMPMADDTQGHMNRGQEDVIIQEPGQADGMDGMESDQQQGQRGQQDQGGFSEQQQDQWSTARTCRDESGTVYQRGTRNFEQCVRAKRQQSQSDDQMGGQEQSGGEMGDEESSGTHHQGSSY